MNSPADSPRTILVPIDFSEASEKAARAACGIAQRTGATVHLLHAYSIPIEGPPGLVTPPSAQYIDQFVTESKSQLQSVADRLCPGVSRGNVLVRSGDARDVIDAVAAEIGADLIVMGTHGRRGLSRVFLGSVAETVVRTAPCSVLVAR